MRTLGGFCIAFFCAGALCAQYRGNPTPHMSGGFPNVVYPGGTPATVPGMTRFRSNVVYPGGGGPQFHVPYSNGFRRSTRGVATGFGYGYPAYVGGFYDYSAYGFPDSSYAAQPQDPNNVNVVYPPPPATASPVIINIGVPPPPNGSSAPPETRYQAPEQQQPEDTAAVEPTHYLIALKDHTIYSAVAYWVDGSTLHYFTTGTTHNQVSLSLVDRDLTQRLNKESGLDVNLPPAR